MEKDEFISRIKECKKEMFLLAVSVVKDYHDAEDAVAETMLRAYEKLATLKDPKRFKFWLMQILVNNCREILRKRQKIICVGDVEPYMPDEEENVSEVWETVLSLEDDLRTIVILHYYQGFRGEEIASMLHLPVGTVKSRLARARKKLRVLLD